MDLIQLKTNIVRHFRGNKKELNNLLSSNCSRQMKNIHLLDEFKLKDNDLEKIIKKQNESK